MYRLDIYNVYIYIDIYIYVYVNVQKDQRSGMTRKIVFEGRFEGQFAMEVTSCFGEALP